MARRSLTRWCESHITVEWWYNIVFYNTSVYFSFSFQIITNDSVCLSVSDGSMLPLIAARLGAKQVKQSNSYFQLHVENSLKDLDLLCWLHLSSIYWYQSPLCTEAIGVCNFVIHWGTGDFDLERSQHSSVLFSNADWC